MKYIGEIGADTEVIQSLVTHTDRKIQQPGEMMQSIAAEPEQPELASEKEAHRKMMKEVFERAEITAHPRYIEIQTQLRNATDVPHRVLWLKEWAIFMSEHPDIRAELERYHKRLKKLDAA
jgi:hypothetical protein